MVYLKLIPITCMVLLDINTNNMYGLLEINTNNMYGFTWH